MLENFRDFMGFLIPLQFATFLDNSQLFLDNSQLSMEGYTWKKQLMARNLNLTMSLQEFLASGRKWYPFLEMVVKGPKNTIFPLNMVYGANISGRGISLGLVGRGISTGWVWWFIFKKQNEYHQHNPNISVAPGCPTCFRTSRGIWQPSKECKGQILLTLGKNLLSYHYQKESGISVLQPS